MKDGNMITNESISNGKLALICGITGQDGSYLAELLLSKGYKVVGVKRRTSLQNASERIDGIFNHPNFKLVYGNITDTASIWKTLIEYKPDEIYNLAAMSHVHVSFIVPEETLDVVAGGTLKILNAMKEICPNARYYQASSSEQYGVSPMPITGYTETSLMTPASPYACAKLFAHNIVRNYRESYGLHASCGILFNHESERRGETFVSRKIAIAAAKIKTGTQDKLFLGEIKSSRDWGHAKDYVEGMWLMLQQPIPEDYVLATGETHSVKEYLEETFKLAGLNVDEHVEIDPRLFRKEEVPLLLGDYSKAKKVLGWAPKIKFKNLVEILYNHEIENIIK